MAVRETNTMAEGLQKMMNEIGRMKLQPDSDLPFLVDLETQIIKYLRPPDPNAQPQGGAPMQPGMGGPPPMGGMGQMAPAMASVVGAGAPNPDEMRRMLG